MSRSYSYRTLDVFTDTAYAGNQLGVITVPKSQPLSQSEKQKIANEFNYSESIFVHEADSASASATNTSSSSPPRVKVDIFTTDSELPFAGHPTIGAIHHVLTQVFPNHEEVIVELKAGPVLGKLDRHTGTASAEIPQEFHQHSKQVTWEDVRRAQPWLGSGSGVTGQHALVSIVRGMNFALVDLSGSDDLLSEVKVTNSNVATREELDDGWPANLIGTLFYTRRPAQQDGVIRIDQRVVVIGLEDPATGSASCALTAYLALEKGGAGAVHRFELVQGEQMGRKSVIFVEVVLNESGAKVSKITMSGRCKAVMKGELEI